MRDMEVLRGPSGQGGLPASDGSLGLAERSPACTDSSRCSRGAFPPGSLRMGGLAQSFRPAGTLPPFFSSSFMTAFWSQIFISALPFFSPV